MIDLCDIRAEMHNNYCPFRQVYINFKAFIHIYCNYNPALVKMSFNDNDHKLEFLCSFSFLTLIVDSVNECFLRCNCLLPLAFPNHARLLARDFSPECTGGAPRTSWGL